MATSQWLMKTIVGPLYLVASDKGLQTISWKKQPNHPMVKSLTNLQPSIKILKAVEKQLTEYFAGKRMNFDVPMDTSGTQFQKLVWSELNKIPYGKTYSYKDVAKKIKNNKAVRAVGTANGRNPIPIIVPCHRVIAADGKLGGYSAGLKIKTILLEIEKGVKQP